MNQSFCTTHFYVQQLRKQAAAQTPSQYVANQKLAQEAQQKSDKQRVEKEATSAMRDPAGAIAGEAGLEDAAGDQLTKTQQQF